MNDEKIVNKIKQGDERTIDAVMQKYSKLLWSIASGVLKSVASEQDVEECVADAFIKLWQEPSKFDSSRGNLKLWLCMVTRSRALDKYREVVRRGELPIDDEILARSLDLEDKVLADERRKLLLLAMASLNEQDRDIIIRRYERDQKPTEIAAALGLPVKQVKNRLYRSKQRLHDVILKQNGGIR